MKNLFRICLLLLLTRSSLSTGLGIDFGGKVHKAAMLLPKKFFTLVEDSISKTKTPSLMTFCKDKRFFEYQSQSKFNKKGCTSFYFMNRFLNHESSKTDQFYKSNAFKFKDHSNPTKDSLGILFNVSKKSFPSKLELPRVQEEENVVPLRFEEIYAMMLRNLKQNAERTAEMKFKNAVFTIWDNSMSVEQRKKLATALIMADLYPSAFVHENTAAAVYFAFNQKFDKQSID